MTDWKSRLADRMPPALSEEIDVFEAQLRMRRDDKIDEKLFAETRLRRGVYGQRYDNGQRNDGERSRELVFPSGDLTKGPETVWDAPGMTRIKIPFGGVTAEQMELLADLGEEYSDDILHVTTRQDIQLHFMHIDEQPDLMRRLAAVGITTKEACGNSVRNVTACPNAGVCNTESFDVTPYATAITDFLMGHPDTADFGRKFKIAFSGCREHACGLAHMHDIGLVGVKRTVDGAEQRGFEFYVGGGLGSVPHKALLLDAFVTESELLPLSQAVCRVFARRGEKRNRAKARLKFVIKKLGLEDFRAEVMAERAKLPEDPRWTAYLSNLEGWDAPAKPPSTLLRRKDEAFDAWFATNVAPQAQDGYSIVTVTLPLGDFTPTQARALADISREFAGPKSMRFTVEQNLVLRWVPNGDLPALHTRLVAAGLGDPGAGTVVDVTACPGTDTCKLGISSSRGLAGELRTRLAATSIVRDEALGSLRIKVSGCFNACGQHHVADIGFLGASRNVGGRRVPNFQVVLGGQWSDNAGAFGLAIGAVPSKRIPAVVDLITDRFRAERDGTESFQGWVKRVGRKDIRESLVKLMDPTPYDVEPGLYRDWGDPREYTIGDMGVGECAGEIVPVAAFGLADAERVVFDAQIALDEGQAGQAAETAFEAMLHAARALIRSQVMDVPTEPAAVVADFRRRFHETALFHDTYAKGKFAQYFFRAAEADRAGAGETDAREFVEEAQLFIEAAHACHDRLLAQGAA